MSLTSATLISIAVCAVAAALEGVCAGRNFKAFFATLRFPPYSAPLWAWSIIGGLYYVIFCFVIYRLLRLGGDSALRLAALALIVFMMLVNALCAGSAHSSPTCAAPPPSRASSRETSSRTAWRGKPQRGQKRRSSAGCD